MAAITCLETEHFGTIPVRHRDCPFCGRDNDDAPLSRYSHGPWAIRECLACGFVYIDQTPRSEAQAEVLAWERTISAEAHRRAEIRPISYKFSKWTRFRHQILPKRTVLRHIGARLSEGNVLDLGCGTGHVLLGLPASFTPFGIEISVALAAAADRDFRARGGRVVNAPCLEGLREFPAGFFAAASLRAYLEHEPEPLPVLEDLHRVLAPGAFAVVKVPNYASLNRRLMGARWCGFRYPEHQNYFTPKTLSLMAAKAGFDTRFGITGRLPTSDNMWAVLTKQAR